MPGRRLGRLGRLEPAVVAETEVLNAVVMVAGAMRKRFRLVGAIVAVVADRRCDRIAQRIHDVVTVAFRKADRVLLALRNRIESQSR